MKTLNDPWRRAAPAKAVRRESELQLLFLIWTLIVSAPALFTVSAPVSAWGVAALVLGPYLALASSRRTLLVAEPALIVGFMWVLAVSAPILLPSFYNDPLWRRISSDYLEQAALWMYRGWAAFSLAYWAMKRARLRLPPATQRDLHIANRLRVAIGVVGLLATLGFLVATGGRAYTHLEGFATTSTWMQILHEARQLLKIYVFLFFFARGRGQLLPRETWLFAATLAMFVLVFAAQASKGVALELLAMWVLGSAAGAKRLGLVKELAFGAIGLAFVLLIFSFVTAYRAELSQTALPDAAQSAVQTQMQAAQRAVDIVASDPFGARQDGQSQSDAALGRLGYVSAFAMLLQQSGGVSPQENAVPSIFAPAFAFLPRDLVGEKVHFFDSGDFARMLGWTFGGFSVTLPGSLYWAWSFEGVLLGMAAFGAGLAYLWRRCLFDGAAGMIARIMLTSVLLNLLNVGVTFQPILINATRVALLAVLLLITARAMTPKAATRASFTRSR